MIGIKRLQLDNAIDQRLTTGRLSTPPDFIASPPDRFI